MRIAQALVALGVIAVIFGYWGTHTVRFADRRGDEPENAAQAIFGFCETDPIR